MADMHLMVFWWMRWRCENCTVLFSGLDVIGLEKMESAGHSAMWPSEEAVRRYECLDVSEMVGWRWRIWVRQLVV